jgi:hypothetical protein
MDRMDVCLISPYIVRISEKIKMGKTVGARQEAASKGSLFAVLLVGFQRDSGPPGFKTSGAASRDSKLTAVHHGFVDL